MECQDFLEREERLNRLAIWPYTKTDDWYISVVDTGQGVCVCGTEIDTFRDYPVGKKKDYMVRAAKHVLVQFYVTTTLGDGIPFKSVAKVRVHLQCVLKTRPDLDMENRANAILLLEGLPPEGQAKLKTLFKEED